MIVDNHSDDEDEPTNWDDDESDADINRPSFPCLHQAIQDAIEHLGGNVFPKMNWSAPRDAAWMGFGNSLKCNSPEQVLPYFLIWMNYLNSITTSESSTWNQYLDLLYSNKDH